MANFAKKVEKNCAADLNGEQIIAATIAQPLGSFTKQVAFGAVGGLVGVAAGAALEKKKQKKAENADEAEGVDTGDDTLASELPKVAMLIAVTEKRLLFFEQSKMSGKPKGLVAAFDHSQVAGMEVEMGKLKGMLKVHFGDESAVTFEVLKASKPDKFIAAYEAK